MRPANCAVGPGGGRRFRLGSAILAGVGQGVSKIGWLSGEMAPRIILILRGFARFALLWCVQRPCFVGQGACFIGGCHKCSKKMRIAVIFLKKALAGWVQ